MDRINSASEYERVLWIHNCIKDGNLSFENYSHKFGMSARTFYRDINDKLINYFNAPIVKKNGKYIYENDTFELPSMLISKQELSALISGLGMIEKFKDTPIYSSLNKIISKLSNSEQIIAKGYKVGNLNTKEISINWNIFSKIANAIEESQVIEIEYNSLNSNRVSTRKLKPYHIYTYSEEIYLAGYCYKNKQVRDFNLNRILSVSILNKKFISNFNIERYFQNKNWGIIKGLKTEEVIVNVNKTDAKWVTEDFPSRFVVFSEDEKWVTYKINTTVSDEFFNWVLGWRDKVKIIKPLSTRKKFKLILSNILKNYKK